MATPLLMAGLRTASLQVVATATIAGFVGAGGLGRYIIDGRATFDNVQIFAGAVLVALFALVTELVLGGAQRVLTPRGMRAELVSARAAAVVATPNPQRKGNTL
jgi:osmoprotectant transport system permease protein